ncbi:LuxR C-terminal-related transcriptional regulator [Nocardioides sp. YJ-D4]
MERKFTGTARVGRLPAREDSSPLAGSWPLVGREHVLRRMQDTLVSGARSLVLAGEMGVGKSRLGHEGVRLARAEGMAITRVTGKLASAGIPLGAFAPVLPVLGHREPGVVDDRGDLLRRCAEALRAQAGGRPLMLFADDAHLLDDTSAVLLNQLAESSWTRVLATVRCREPAPDPVVALWKDGLAHRVEVEGLDLESVSRALTAALKGAVDDAAVTTLAQRARGNMLFLRELVLGAVEEGVLSTRGGVWRLSGDLHPTARLVELVEARLAGLSVEERAAMELVSFGEPLGLDQLETLVDADTAEALERKGLIEGSSDQQRLCVGLAHPLYGEVIRSRTPAIRARGIVRSLADVVEGTGNDDPADLIRVASWRLTLGSTSPDLMLRAGVAARWRFDFPLAERLAQAAVVAGAGFEAELLTAQLAGLQGRSEEGARRLAALAEGAVGWREQGQVTLSRLDNRVIYAGTIDEGLRIAEEGLAALGETPMADEIAARHLALVLAKDGPGAAVEVSRPILERASGRALVWACMPAAYSLGRAGFIDEALAASRHGWKTQSALSEPMDWYPWMHRFYEAEALVHSGRLLQAEELSLAEYQRAIDDGSNEAQGLFSWQLAKSVADRGHVGEAIRRTQLAAAVYDDLDRPQFVQFCLIYQVLALAIGRRPEEARAALGRLDSLSPEPNFFMGADLAHARAWLAIAEGDIRGGRDLLLEAAALGERIGDVVGATVCLHSASRVGYASEVVGRLEELATGMQGELARARGMHARALADGLPEDLEQVATSFDQMGATLLAAEVSNDAALLWRQRREPRRAAAAERRAAWFAERCDGAATPGLQAASTRSRLTAAEWEAVQLAAAGRANKQIALELSISVRTVENRLQHAYGKLGISSRSDLPAALETMQEPRS